MTQIYPGEGAGLPRLSKPFTQAKRAEALARIHPRIGKRGRILKFRAGTGPAV